MKVEFRCENCGKLLNIDAEPSSKIKCPYCKAKITVPAGIASMPTPKVSAPPAKRPESPPAPPTSTTTTEQAEEESPEEREEVMMGVMAKLMPWVISLFFHAGIMVILAFIAIVAYKTNVQANTIIPDMPLTDQPGGVLNPGEMNPELKAKSLERINQKQWARRESTIPTPDIGKTKSRIILFGKAGGAAGGGPTAAFGLTAGGAGQYRSRFFGTGGTARDIVYVVDRSGSMLDTFDAVRKEMIRSITRLSPAQRFHVIFFATGKPKENPPRRLVPATVENKRIALKFLHEIIPEGQTDPIPALQRAFAVLKAAPGSKKGQLIYLLTDGEFPDNEKVLQEIRRLNAKRTVHINTILHWHHSPEVMKVLQQIAKENKGTFKFVQPE